MNFFWELDLASATWWARDKIIIAKGFMTIMTLFFISALVAIPLFNSPALGLESYIAGFIGYCFGYYMDTIIGEVIHLVRKLFKKGESK